MMIVCEMSARADVNAYGTASKKIHGAITQYFSVECQS